jgi:membrane fusion protein, multidrug efflux system
MKARVSNALLALSLVAAPVLAQTPAARPAVAKPAPLSLEQQDIRAQLAPRNYTTLAAEVGAKINRIAVKPGQAFKAGQVLVSFDCSLQNAQRARAQAELDGAQKTHAVNKRLQELDAVGKLEYATSEQATLKARAELDFANATLAKCRITAPFSGRVAEQKAREQQFVQAGQPLLEILDDSSLDLDFIVPSKWLAWLKVGQTFKVAIDENGQTYPARVTRLGARIDPVSQSIGVAAVIDGSFHELIAGMSGRVLLTPPTR